MPRAPKWAADLMENAFSNKFRKVTVVDTEYLSPTLRKIRFAGDFSTVNFGIGQAVLFRVDNENYRNYTPSLLESQAGICEIVFHVHNKGPGSQFVAKLEKGDTLRIGLPRGFNLHQKESRYHFFFGDESTLGFFQSLKNEIHARQQNYFGVLELDSSAIGALDKLGLMIDVVQKSSTTHAGNAIRFLSGLDESLLSLWKTGTFYLMGNAQSIQHFRKALRARGVSQRSIITQPYWAEGKAGL